MSGPDFEFLMNPHRKLQEKSYYCSKKKFVNLSKVDTRRA